MPGTKARPSELRNFFWHCLIAAKLVDELLVDGRPNAAVSSNVAHAIRKATACWDGRDGVGYATPLAIETQRQLGVHWEKCGLIREHVVPVALVTACVRKALESTRGLKAPACEMTAEERSQLPPDVATLFEAHPRAWQVAQQVRAWTVQAWITSRDQDRLDDTATNGCNLTKSMPPGWDETQSRFARYDHCGLRLEPVV